MSRTVVRVLALVLATSGAVAACSGEPTPASELPTGVDTCPPPDAPPARTGPDDVPLGAVGMRVCGGPLMPVQAVPELLTTGLDSFAELINDLDRNNDTVCTDQGGPDYELVFSYPGGRVQHVAGGLGGCGTITVGSRARDGADVVLDEVTERFEAQRAATAPPADLVPPPLRCPERTSDEPDRSLLATGADMTRAVLCVALEPQAQLVVAEVAVSAAELRVLLDDLAAGVVGDETCTPLDPRLLLLGSTAWGDLVSERLYCVGFQGTADGGYVALGAEGLAIVARATQVGVAARRTGRG